MFHFFPPQSGYIDGPILSTFHTNLVILPAVMEYMQYGFIGLGVATIIIAALVYHRVKVRMPHSLQAGVCYYFLTACGMLHHYSCSSKNRWKKERLQTKML